MSSNCFGKNVILEQGKGVHCVDLGESFQTHIYLQNFVSIQPRTSPVKFAASRDKPVTSPLVAASPGDPPSGEPASGGAPVRGGRGEGARAHHRAEGPSCRGDAVPIEDNEHICSNIILRKVTAFELVNILKK